ncbi:hypothetical protein IFO70_24485 [Phormidium tenue FACHB-886]|nr:hypothetical protein [Phormidium tenue FACHB-886]
MAPRKKKPVNPQGKGTPNQNNNQRPDYTLPKPPWQYEGDLGDNATIDITGLPAIPITILNTGIPGQNNADDFDGFAYDLLIWELDDPAIGFSRNVYLFQESSAGSSKQETVPLRSSSSIKAATLFIADSTYPAVREGTDDTDLLMGTEATNGISGGAGNDLILTMEDQDSAAGGDGNDLLNGGSSDDVLVGNSGNDRLYGEQGSDRLSGLDGQDTLTGGSGNDRLSGGNGNDQLLGETGNDVLSGEAGSDTLTGGNGDDSYLVIDAEDAVVEQPNQGDDTVLTILNFTLGNSLENLTLVGSEAVVGVGNSLDNRIEVGDQKSTLAASLTDFSPEELIVNNIISGAGGDDLIRAGAGDDRLDGGEGNDTLAGGKDNDTLTGDAGIDRFLLGSFEFSGSSEEGDTDTITDFNAAQGDKLYLSTQNFSTLPTGAISPERFVLGTSATTPQQRLVYNLLTGELFFDKDGSGAEPQAKIVTFTNRPALITSDFIAVDNLDPTLPRLLTNLPLIVSGVSGASTAADDRLFGGQDDNVISGGAGNDTIDGGNGKDTLNGGSGDDRLEGGNNDDNLNGGEGNDRLTDVGGTNNILNGENGNDTLNSDFGNDSLNGGGNDDILIGNFGEDNLQGGEGNDRLTGGDGRDTLTGGTGADLFILTDASDFSADTITDFDRAQGDKIQIAVSADFSGFNIGARDYSRFGYNSSTGELLFDAIVIAKLTPGTALNLREDLTIATTATGTTLNGNANANQLLGSEGADLIKAAGGNDVVSGLEGNDEIAGGSGSDWLEGGSSDDSVNGDRDSDQLYGEAGNDLLNGGAGNDILAGGAGNDTLTGGSGADRFSFYDPLASIVDPNTGDRADPVTDGTDVLTDLNRAEDTIGLYIGSYSPDSLYRQAGLALNTAISAGQFQLGSSAADASDRLIYDRSTGDLFFDVDGTGAQAQIKIATLSTKSALSHTNIVTFNDLTTTQGTDSITGQATRDQIVGRRGDDVLNGGGGADRLSGDQDQDIIRGGAGRDRLKGGVGNDHLLGGLDSDWLEGGKGRDRFILERGAGNDVILDFKDKEDRLGLAPGIQAKRLKIIQRGRNTLIELRNDRLAVLNGVEASQITMADFVQNTIL